MMKIINMDPWLKPYSIAIEGRHFHAIDKEKELTEGGSITLKQYASGYEYYGLHRLSDGWIFREWAPNATSIFLVGDFSDWKEQDQYKLNPIGNNGDWEVILPLSAVCHGQHYKIRVYWKGGNGDRIPAYCNRIVQEIGRAHV